MKKPILRTFLVFALICHISTFYFSETETVQKDPIPWPVQITCSNPIFNIYHFVLMNIPHRVSQTISLSTGIIKKIA